jgi:hypothetical protein
MNQPASPFPSPKEREIVNRSHLNSSRFFSDKKRRNVFHSAANGGDEFARFLGIIPLSFGEGQG